MLGISSTKIRAKLSGPLLDRIDLQIEVPRLSPEELLNMKTDSEPSSEIRKRVVNARKIQAQRYAETNIFTNSELSSKLIKNIAKLMKNRKKCLKQRLSNLIYQAEATTES